MTTSPRDPSQGANAVHDLHQPGVPHPAGERGRPGAPQGAIGRLADTVERLRRELEQAHHDAHGRALLDVAKGVLVERLKCSPLEAAGQLETLAAQTGSSAIELAADLVNQASRDRITDLAREFVADVARPASPSIGVRLRTAEAGATGDAQAMADSILQHALHPLGATAVVIWAANPDQSLTLAASAGFTQQEPQRWRHVPPGVPTPARRCLDERAALSYPTLSASLLASIGQSELSGGRVAVPAGTGGRIVGVLEICWPHPLPEQPQSVQRQLEVLAELCAATLETAPHLDAAASTDRDPRLTELLELADALTDSCLVLQPISDDAGNAADFLIRHVNHHFVDFAGRPRTRIAGARLLDAYPLAAEPGGLFEKIDHVLATGEPFRTDRMTLSAMVDGIPITTAARVVISRQGAHVLVMWELDDGAAQVASLLQHAQRLGRIGGFEENLLTCEIAWNDTLFDLHGLAATARPLPLDQLSAHSHPDDAHSIGRFLRTLLHHGRPASVAFRLQRADTFARHIRVVAEPVLDDSARVVAVRGAYQDVSAQHWTEVALAATRDQLAHTEQEAAERSRLALQLQHAIMPPSSGPADLLGLRIGVRYRPAEKDHLVGGDWYDAVPLPNGQVLLCVGDIAGHGIEAATGMVALRNALRGLATTGADPGQLLAWLNTVTHHFTDQVTATAVCALYDPATGRLRWARAGHLPPILLRGGTATPLPPVAGILLGAVEGAEYQQGEIQLTSGDVLLMYTDGLIERRDCPVSDSIDDLLALAQDDRSPNGPDDLERRLDHLLRHADADTDDDTCLIGVRVD
ncbi:SpoIIE family protein phosphatase [Kitasatospora sp. NPDC002040]|uniref:SpoIIE family protein phosphatase n=1 Tax=Kitasatospora sp. NPDC002040 TaxID=3154661 RepID=UPI00332A23C9